MPAIVFCFPYRAVGGVPLLFLRVGEDLAARGLARVFFVDYADGFMARHRGSDQCTLIEYQDGSAVQVPEDATLVLQAITPWSLYPALRIPARCKILYWNCHPFNLVPTLPGFRRQMQANPMLGRSLLATLLRGYRSTMRSVVQFMTERRALVFMDASNVRTTERYLGISIPAPVFLPVPAAAATRERAGDPPDLATRGLRVAWVGRIVAMKYHVLKHTLEEMNRIAPECPHRIRFTVIGSGDWRDRLRRDAARMTGLEIRFVDHVPPSELDDFLITEVDLLVAMGTSALEGARLGVPTILLDVAYGPVPAGYRFTWLYERTGYTLGDLVGPEHIAKGNRSLAIKLSELARDFERVSRQTRDYFEANHALSAVSERLLQSVAGSACTYGDMVAEGLMRRGLAYRLFSAIRRRFLGNESSHTGGRTGHPS